MKAPADGLAAVVFDLDGTLVDTAPEFIILVNALRERHKLHPLPDERIRPAISYGARGMVSLALDLSPEAPEFNQHLNQFLADYERTLGQHAKIYDGLRDVITELSSRGIRWGVVTNKLRRFAAPLMEKLAFTPPADSLVTPSDVSHCKPHPEPLYRCCQELDVHPARTLYVGDHKRDIDAGRAAGCLTIAAAYGYVGDDNPLEWRADRIAPSSPVLCDFIRELM
jgi:phosphoglycolate phosphatase